MASTFTELQDFIETLDLTPQEEETLARILEKLLDEATTS